MKKLIAVLLIALSANAAAERVNAISVKDLFSKFESTEDLTYMADSFERCSSLLTIIGLHGNMDEFVVMGSDYLEAGFNIRTLRAKLQGWEPHTPELTIAWVGKDTDMYLKRMNENVQLTGDNWGSDPFMVNDIQYCRSLHTVAQIMKATASN